MTTTLRSSALALGLALLPVHAAAQQAPPTPASRCADEVGAWSPAVDGLRARLRTSGTRPDRSALRLVVELENLSPREVRELSWTGPMHHGFVTTRLTIPGGAEVPAPDWAFGGNEFTGDQRLVIPAGATVRLELADNLYTQFMGHRVVRVGTFWARELPADGARRAFHARVTGGPPHAGGSLRLEVNPATGELRQQYQAANPHTARAWQGVLELPPVCVD